jgi:hypothetical protein
MKQTERKQMSNKTTYKIVIHNPDKVDMNDDILDDQSRMWEIYKDFDCRADAKKWLSDYIEVIEMLN